MTLGPHMALDMHGRMGHWERTQTLGACMQAWDAQEVSPPPIPATPFCPAIRSGGAACWALQTPKQDSPRSLLAPALVQGPRVETPVVAEPGVSWQEGLRPSGTGTGQSPDSAGPHVPLKALHFPGSS